MMYGRKGLEPLAMPMAAWLAWLESASSMWSAMSIPATAPARLQELLQINGRLGRHALTFPINSPQR